MEPAFDLSQFEAADTATLEVQNLKGDGPLMAGDEPVLIELYGPGSEQYARAQAKVDGAGQARAFAAIRGKMTKDMAAENRRLQAEKFAACTKSISANFPVAPLDLYGNPKLGYVVNQVEKFIDDWANFPAASSTT